MKLCIKNLADQNGYTKIRLAKELNMSRQYIYSLYDGSVKSIKIEKERMFYYVKKRNRIKNKKYTAVLRI